jgi:hypothetical protein
MSNSKDSQMKVGGRDFNLTKREVETRMEGVDPELIQKHMLEVNGQMFPPKQVLGHVTGWERTSFTTMEAQRVLTRIGFVCTETRSGAVRQAGHFVLDTVRDSVRQPMIAHGDAQFQGGFSAAAGITLRNIQRRLDGFREQMKGPGLSQAEQAIYAHMDELKSEIEADCDRFWRGSGVDWRPLRPVAKGVLRHADEANEEV